MLSTLRRILLPVMLSVAWVSSAEAIAGSAINPGVVVIGGGPTVGQGGAVIGALPYTPARLGSALSAYWDASHGVVLNVSAVSAWAVRFGVLSVSANQSTALNQPSFISSDAKFGGRPSICGDGVYGWLQVAAMDMSAASTMAWFVTVYDTTTTASVVLELGPDGGATQGSAALFVNDSVADRINITHRGSVGQNYAYAAPFTLATATLVESGFDFTGDVTHEHWCYVNDAVQTLTHMAIADNPSANKFLNSTFNIFARTGAVAPLKGCLRSIALMNRAPTASERTRQARYQAMDAGIIGVQ